MSDPIEPISKPKLHTKMASTLSDLRALLESISTEGKIRHIIGKQYQVSLRQLRQTLNQGGKGIERLRSIVGDLANAPDDTVFTYGKQRYIPVEEFMQSLQEEYPTGKGWQLVLTEANQIVCVEILVPVVHPLADAPTEERLEIQGMDTVQVGESVSLELIEPAPAMQPDFLLPTSQEVDALASAMADGRLGEKWQNDHQAGTRTYAPRNQTHHYVQLMLKPEEVSLGLSVDMLKRLTDQQDADGILAVFYVSDVVKHDTLLPSDAYAGKRIKIDDIMEKIGWDPRSTKERQEMRRRVWNYLVFGERAYVHGERTIPYYDKLTKELIPTRLDAPLWRLMAPQFPDQGNLFPPLEIPLSIDIVLSKEWERLLTDPSVAQYLPFGERLGKIPANQISGAWARVIGVFMMMAWRIYPEEALEGIVPKSRKDILTHFTPKGKSVFDILSDSKNRGRACNYWHDALHILSSSECGIGILSNEGEAMLTLEEMKKAFPRKERQEEWLNGIPALRPSPLLRPIIKEIAEARYIPKPKPLQKGGRRKKTSDSATQK